MIRCPRCHVRLRRGTCDEHGPPTRPRADPLPSRPPAELPTWRQGRCLAIGGSAQVFGVEGEPAAVIKWARWRDAAARRRFEREAAHLRHLRGTSVPELHAAGVVDGWPYLVLERLAGESLAERLASQERAALARDAVTIVRRLADAVAGLHARDVVHADLKPENVFVSGDRSRLVDLGLAVRTDQAGDPVDGVTVHYAAPEQLHGEQLTPATDVYALAAIAFELVTGRPPFVGDRPAIEYGHTLCRPPRPGELAEVSGELEALILAGLAKRPAQRPPLDAFRAVVGRADVSASRVARLAPARRSERGPAALVWVSGGSRPAIARALVDAAGRIVRERADGTLGVFLWHDHDHPVRAAAALAITLPPELSVVVHSGDVLVRRSSTRLALHGELVDHPERWCPAVPCAGVLFTSAAAQHLDEELAVAHTAPGFLRLAEHDRARSQRATVPDLVACVGVVEAAAAAISGAFADASPRLITIEGASGAGKTRALLEIGRRVDRATRLVELAGTTNIAGRPSVGPQLAAALADLPGPSLLDRLRAATERGVVILVDNGHRVEDELLEMIETAAGWRRARLAIVLACDASLFAARPRWAERATHHDRYALPPLDDDEAQHLLRRLLAPARRIPDALVARLAARAAGNPGALTGLAREIHRRGLIRRFPGAEEFHIAADEIDSISLEPDRRWRAARELAALPPGMAALVSACAVLGGGFDRAELEAAHHAAPQTETAIDPTAGLAWLERNRVLRHEHDGWRFVDTTLEEQAAESVPDDARVAIHVAALAHVEATSDARDDERLGRIAHHARGATRRDLAATAFLTLAARARVRHGHVEAERMATMAIEALAGETTSTVAAALVERARARRRMALFETARGDLVRARALAIELGSRALEIETLIEEGAICDFSDRLVESAAAIERAAALAARGAAPALAARVDNWLGVVRARQGRLAEAETLLRRAIAAAEPGGDHETVVGSTLMLGGVLRRTSRVADAREALDRAIARSEDVGDSFHLTVGLFNRMNLGRLLGAAAEAEADCARAIEIAERHGYGQMEIAGWLNLSEAYLAAGRDDDALVAARRGFEVARRRFGERPPIVVTSWLAVLEAGLGHRDEARALLAAIDAAEAERSPLLRLRRAALVAITSPSASLEPVIAGVATLEETDRAAFHWFLDRVRMRGSTCD